MNEQVPSKDRVAELILGCRALAASPFIGPEAAALYRDIIAALSTAHEPPPDRPAYFEYAMSFLDNQTRCDFRAYVDRLERSAHPPHTAIALIANDAYAATFQTMAQYRAALISSLRSTQPPVPELPEELFDGHAVWLEAGNVQSRDVTRVLDAVVKLIKKRQSRPTKAPAQPDPLGCLQCTHTSCDRFYDHNAGRWQCRAMAQNACASPSQGERNDEG